MPAEVEANQGSANLHEDANAQKGGNLQEISNIEETQKIIQQNDPELLIEPTVPLKRSSRVKDKINYKAMATGQQDLRDIGHPDHHAHVALANKDPPATYSEAVNRQDVAGWLRAMEKEVQSLVDNLVFEVVERPARNLIGSRWVFSGKLMPGGEELLIEFKPKRSHLVSLKVRIDHKQWTRFEDKDCLYFLDNKFYCYVLSYLHKRGVAYISDGGNTFREDQNVADELKSLLKIRLISLPFNYHFRGFCRSLALLIG